MPGLDFLGEIAKLLSSQEASREMVEILKHLPDDINSHEEFQKCLKDLNGLNIKRTLFGGKKICYE